MLGLADYVIIALVILGMIVACRHIFRSYKSGSCPGCGCCGGGSRGVKRGDKKHRHGSSGACCCSNKKETCSGSCR